MKDLFINFLKEHNLYFRFQAYYSMNTEYQGKTFEEYLNTQNPSQYVVMAFPWCKTDDGIDFWSEINKLWKEYREKHSTWGYEITFKSEKLEDAELIRDIAKLLEEKYHVKCSGNLKTSSVKLS